MKKKNLIPGLSKFESLTLRGGEELEKALKWVATQIEQFVHYQHVRDFDFASLQNWLDFYSQKKWIEQPESFYPHPKTLPKVTRTTMHHLQDGEVFDLSFKSSYKPINKEYAKEFKAYKENQTFYARVWKHQEPAKATIVAVHGWTMGDQRINSLAFLPGLFYQLGLDMVIIELPFHGRRVCKDEREKRVIFPGAHVARTNEGIAQTIWDLRMLNTWLESQGAQNIGCMGMSLGGYISALWSSLDELQFCIPIVPVANMGTLAWEIISKKSEFSVIEKQGITVDDLELAFRVHCPLAYTPKLPLHRRMIIAGLADHIVPPRHPHLLWEHWQHPEIHWLSGGHMAHFRRSKAVTKMTEFFQRNGLTSKN
ncbi:MAG: alpha/beta hydrolase family protein [Deltaproteobacteria bacterium]|nr:alpha/beta hydrolase family protein [Deltaproteobacteria bacterium]